MGIMNKLNFYSPRKFLHKTFKIRREWCLPFVDACGMYEILDTRFYRRHHLNILPSPLNLWAGLRLKATYFHSGRAIRRAKIATGLYEFKLFFEFLPCNT